MPLKIYEAEKKAGLTEKLSATASLTLFSAAKPGKLITPPKNISLIASEISEIDKESVYPIDSILVSSTVNRNDVFFQAPDIFTARHTPVNKPVNNEHNEFDIIGVTIGSHAVDDEMEAIAEDTDPADLAGQKIHIVNNDLIYKYWRDDDRREQIAEIISEIESSKDGDAIWFVSMECFFDEFDYAVRKSSGVYNIVSRTEDTAYLTEHLRVWGGTGMYGGHKVVMVPRNFIFSGKGIVKSPANPDSVILNATASAKTPPKKPVFISSSKDGVKQMDHDALIADLKSKNEALIAKVESLTASVAQKEVDGLKAQISDLTASVEGKDKAVATLNDTIASLTKDIDTLKAEKADADKSVTDLRSEVATLKAANLSATRKAALVAAGADADQADTLAASFSALSDEVFATTLAALTPTFAKAAVSTEADPAKTGPKMMNTPEPATKADAADGDGDEEEMDDDEPKGKKKGAKAAIAAIDNAEPEAAPVVPKSQDSETKAVFSAIAGFLGSAEPLDRKTVTKRGRRKKAAAE